MLKHNEKIEKHPGHRASGMTMYSSLEELNNFFSSDVKSKQDLFALRVLDDMLATAYRESLAKYLGLSYAECEALYVAKYAIATFTDICFRLSLIGTADLAGTIEPLSCIEEYEPLAYSGFPLTVSLKGRIEMGNKISQTIFGKTIFQQVEYVPEKISLEEMGIRPSPYEKKWHLINNLTKRIYENLACLVRIAIKRMREKLSGRPLIRIGYTVLNTKFMQQIPEMDFVPLQFSLNSTLNPASLIDSKKIFDAIKDSFVSKVLGFKEWDIISPIRPTRELAFILLSNLVMTTDSILCDGQLLAKLIGQAQEQIKKAKVRGIIGLANWNVLKNGILSVAAQRMGLPVIEYQLGGMREIFEEGLGYGNEDPISARNCLSWSEWTSEKTRFFKIPDPALQNLNRLGKRMKGRIKRRGKWFKILYTPPAVSLIYPVEHFDSYNADNIKAHRQLMENVISQVGSIPKARFFVKIKGFDYALFRGHEENLAPNLSKQKMPIEYIFTGIASKFFDFVNVHFTDSVSTTFDESMAYNIPTIGFWDSNILTTREKYRNLYDRMRKVGILVTNAEEAHSSIRRVYEDPDWWYSDEIQKIRDEFTSYFAHCQGDWRKEIHDALKVICAH